MRCTRAGGGVGFEFNVKRARRVNLVVLPLNRDARSGPGFVSDAMMHGNHTRSRRDNTANRGV